MLVSTIPVDFNLCLIVGHGHASSFTRYITAKARQSLEKGPVRNSICQFGKNAKPISSKERNKASEFNTSASPWYFVIPIWHSLSRYGGDSLATRTAQASQANLVLFQLLLATPITLLEQRSTIWRQQVESLTCWRAGNSSWTGATWNPRVYQPLPLRTCTQLNQLKGHTLNHIQPPKPFQSFAHATHCPKPAPWRSPYRPLQHLVLPLI